MELGAVEKVIKHFNEFSKGSNLPTVTVEAFFPRTDDPEILKAQIKQFGLSEEVNLGEGTSVLIGPTPAAAPHTSITMENEEGNTVPAHRIVWLLKEGEEETSPTSYQDLDILPEDARMKVLNAVGRSIYKSVKTIEQMSPNDSTHAAIYAVVGHAPVLDQMETGLIQGPQSNPNIHIHIADLSPEKLYKSMKVNETAKPSEMLKHISLFDTLFHEKLENVIVRKLNNQYGDILNAKGDVDHNKHPEFEGISFFEGYKLKFKEDGVDFAIAMDVLIRFTAEAQKVYAKMLGFYENFYQNIADPEKKEEISQLCRNELKAFGCSEVEAILLQKQVFSLSPTLLQLKLWLKGKDGLPDDDPNKKILKQRLFQYEKHKMHLQDPQKRDSLKERLIKNHHLQPEEANIILTLLEDKLKDGGEDGLPKFTMPGQLSLGYSFDYEVQGDQLIVKSITLATRFSAKSIYEDMVGYTLDRPLQAV